MSYESRDIRNLSHVLKIRGRMAIIYGQYEKQKNGKEKKGEGRETNPKLEPKSKS
jgi:hypothetical protein